MTRPVNLFAISRIRDEESFNRVEMHQSQRTEKSRIQHHEMDSLRRLVDRLMLLDDTFYYDENRLLQGIPHPDPDYLYPNLFYQGVTRVREKLALIVINAPELFREISTICGQVSDCTRENAFDPNILSSGTVI